MDLFVEREFIEEFELDYDCSEKKSEIQKIVFSIFTEFTRINLFINAPDSFINESRILSLFSDSNLNIKFNVDFEQRFFNPVALSNQTLIFTKHNRSWFYTLENKGAMCFSYKDYEVEIQNFISRTHFKIDLSDPENIPINWNIFKFLKSQTNFIILSDSYILSNCSGQEIRKNLIPLLKENLNKNRSYSIFIFTEVDKEDINSKIGLLYSALNGFKVKLFVFNILPQCENMDLHDRVLYSKYTITDSGKGFNLFSNKPKNSQIVSASIFEKQTYKRLNNHFELLRNYVAKLEKFNPLNNPYKTNSDKAYKAFNEIIANS
jgi:hypothetical protein